jgi:hemerythrin superfamily protein
VTDVVELITQQHRMIDELLEQAEKAEPGELLGLLQQVADLLTPHSQAEESFVYPAIAKYDRDEADEVKDGTAEHHHVEGLLEQLLSEDPSGPGYDGKLAAMIGELRHHVEEEEQELLPVLSEKASEAQREELGARFAEETGSAASRAGTGSKATSASPDGGSSQGDLTRDELYRKAQERDVPGRSSMTKAELAEAVGTEAPQRW